MKPSARNVVESCVIGLAAAVLVVACQPAGESSDDPAASAATPAASSTAPPGDAFPIEIVTTDYAFTAPPSFPSGWVPLRLRNDAEQPHFVVLWRLPEGIDFADYSAKVVGPFTTLYKEYRAGRLDQPTFFNDLLAALPEWFPLEGWGGVALTSPGNSSLATVYLEPGNYVMECYVRAREPEGDKFHNELGMLRPLIVTDEPSGVPEPQADVRITLSNYEIAVEGELRAGELTVAVTVTEAPEGLVGHDINLARLEADTNLEEVAAWMSWVEGLQVPAPAEFLGGSEELAPGRTSYFTTTLQPGRYALISEGYGAQGMVREFSIQ